MPLKRKVVRVNSGDGAFLVLFGALRHLSLSSPRVSLHLSEPGKHGLPDSIFVGICTRQSVCAAFGT